MEYVPQPKDWDLSRSVVIHPALGAVAVETLVAGLPIVESELPANWLEKPEELQDLELREYWAAVCEWCDQESRTIYILCSPIWRHPEEFMRGLGLREVHPGVFGGRWPSGDGKRLFPLAFQDVHVMDPGGEVLFWVHETWDSVLVATASIPPGASQRELELPGGLSLGVGASIDRGSGRGGGGGSG